MQYVKAELLGSAANRTQWPENELPEVIFAGRSNAGKSSLINALTNRKNLAYSGKTPGKTRLLNFFTIDDRLVFTDAPGYGYATSDKASALAFHQLIDVYFRDRKQLKGMVLVLDSRRVPSADDITMTDFARASHLPVIAACTKSDKLSRSQLLANMRKIAEVLNISPSACYPCSSLKKTGLDEVRDAIDRMTK